MKDILSEIISRVRAEVKNQAEAVTAGTNIVSFEDYKQHIGCIRGLQLTLDIIDEVLTEDDEQ
jgi:hypothetical protein